MSQTAAGGCWNYAANQLPLVAADGSNALVSLTNEVSATFTSSPTLAFGPGIPVTQTITVVGNPTPTVCIESSNLTGNFKIAGTPSEAWKGTNCNALSGGSGLLGTVPVQLKFDGLLTAPVGVYSLTLKAANRISGGGLTTVSQTFSINVSPQLAIISPNSMSVTSGVPASFTVVATGVPSPTLSIDGVPLGGMTFTDNGNGTATISGINNNVLTIQNCKNLVTNNPCGIVATNSQETFRQPFNIYVSPAPAAALVGPSAATFYAGAPNRVVLASTGAITPVSWGTAFGRPPSWVTLTDNGDGTATLSGTPPPGTTGKVGIGISLSAANSLGLLFVYTITVLNEPVFTSPGVAIFTVGTPGSSSISSNTGVISLTDSMPDGLFFEASGSTATISGTPAAGTGGQYTLTLNNNTGTNGTVTQPLALDVYEAPQITSASTATMFVGTPGLFAVTTTGFPNVSNAVVPANAPPPTDPSQGAGMNFTVTGLPPGLQASNLNAAGFAVGTLTIQGTPTVAGTYPVQITAQNGVGQPAQQTLTLNILSITGSAPASATTCNGNYNGKFKGDITVSDGQNCAFYGGTVSGHVTVLGGYLALNNATVTGHVQIRGASGFSIGQGSNISGNLTIESVGSGSTASQVCGSTVNGDLQVTTSAIPIQIGNPQNSCSGNTIYKNIVISANTASVTVYGNTVTDLLACSGNSSITGGGNSARHKSGQCVPF